MLLLRRSILLACLALPALPATASATTTVWANVSTVVVESTTAGEASDLTVTAGSGTFTVRDEAGLPLDANGTCLQGGDASEAVCTVGEVTRITMRLGPGDDTVRPAADTTPRHIHGEAGHDVLAAGAGDDLVTGGAGVDSLSGEGGDDRLESEDGTSDAAVDCGAGDDDLLGDVADDEAGCEVVAPRISGAVGIDGGPLAVGGQLVPTPTFSVTGTMQHPTARVAFRWYRCGQACALVQDDPRVVSYDIQLADGGHSLYAEVVVSNRAGQASVTTPRTGIVPPLAAPAPIVPRPPAANDPFALWSRELGPRLRTALAPLARRDIRSIARSGRVRMTVRLPVPDAVLRAARGPLRIDWTIPRSVARRYGIAGRGAAPVFLARGVVTRPRASTARVDVRLTSAGRAVLRRARRLTTTVAVSLVVDPAGAGVATRQPLTLRRR